MTYRPRRQAKPSLRTRLGRLVEGDERQQAVVTVLFIVAIAAVVLILIGAIAFAWYNDNLRPLGRVGPVEIGPQLLRDEVNLQEWRIGREQNRVTQAQIDGEIDAETAQARLTALDQQLQTLSTSALENLIDVIFQSQLAAQEGISVSQADVDERLAREFAGVEQRHVLAIVVEPQAADEEAGPTVVERRAALERAEAALAEINAGTAWADVAREYGTDDGAQNGGDLGVVTPNMIGDADFATEVFALERGATTGIVRGGDAAYRIGRVTEIVQAAEEPGLRDDLLADVPEANVRQLLSYELAAAALNDKIVAQALAETPEQVRISVIYIEGLSTDDPGDAEGEVDYSEIVFAPKDDLLTAPELPAEDQAWTDAQTEAQATLDELNAITDVEERTARFEEIAIETSDSPTGEDAGAVGFVTRSIAPAAVADALFEGTHEEGDLLGPVRGDAAYYVLMFHERRSSPEARLQAVKDALAVPGADFNEVARELSDGPEKEDGGEVGWLTRDQLSEDIADTVFGLDVGEVSEPIELGEGHYFVKLEEKGVRLLDADQIPNVRFAAFQTWYTEKKDAAEANGTIVRSGDEGVTDVNQDPGLDQGTP